MGSIEVTRTHVGRATCDCGTGESASSVQGARAAVAMITSLGWRVFRPRGKPPSATCPNCLRKAHAAKETRRANMAEARAERDEALRVYREKANLRPKAAFPGAGEGRSEMAAALNEE